MNLKEKKCISCGKRGFTKAKNNFLVCMWCGKREKIKEPEPVFTDIEEFEKNLNKLNKK